jgi:hypothetical protein
MISAAIIEDDPATIDPLRAGFRWVPVTVHLTNRLDRIRSKAATLSAPARNILRAETGALV